MATAKRRKVSGINPFPNVHPNLISSFERASELKKRRDKRRVGIPDRLYNLIVGEKGEGKSYTSLLLAEQMKKEVEKKLYEESKEPRVAVYTEDKMNELSKPARQFFAAAGEFAYGAAGGGGGRCSTARRARSRRRPRGTTRTIPRRRRAPAPGAGGRERAP
jgi:hypothetical protein